jgi:hypothetical protein
MCISIRYFNYSQIKTQAINMLNNNIPGAINLEAVAAVKAADEAAGL